MQLGKAQKLDSVVSAPLGVILKTVPCPLAPPAWWCRKIPSAAWISAAKGYSPSVQLGSVQKLYSVVSAPLGVIL